MMEGEDEVGSANVSEENQMMFGDACDKFSLLLQKITDFFPLLEELRPEKAGMQALCEVHLAVDKAGDLLLHIMNSSKFYSLITSDCVLLKFRKVQETLKQALKYLELNIPDTLAKEVVLFSVELEAITIQLSALHQDSRMKMNSLLQREKEYPCLGSETEVDVFEEVSFDLGITSVSAIQNEKKALKRLLGKVRVDHDRKKELIVLYLLHLLRKLGKLQKRSCITKVRSFRDAASSTFSQSLSERGSEATSTSERDSDLSSELSYYETLKQKNMSFAHTPEEFRCPISLQLMSDPVIISSGQTYERICIEKWFEQGHRTCPKTQQNLAHLQVTPNYCVKGLIMSWCEKQSMPMPTPPSLPLLSQCLSLKITDKGFIPQEEKPSDLRQREDSGRVHQYTPKLLTNHTRELVERTSLKGDAKNTAELVMDRLCSSSLDVQHSAAKEIRYLTKDDVGARALFGHLGCIPALVAILSNAMEAGDEDAVTTACLALSNVSVNNDRNREELVSAGVVPLVLSLLQTSCSSLASREVAILVLWSISCLQENRLENCLPKVVQLLVEHLGNGSTQGIKDALSTLLNLSAFHGNQICMAKANVIPKLIHFVSLDDTELFTEQCKDAELTTKCLSILYRLSSIEEGRNGIIECENCIPCLVDMLDTGSQMEKELVAAIFLVICTCSSTHSQIILEEGIIPSLVMISVNGTERGKVKAQKLLQHFRQQRQKESTWHSAPQVSSNHTNTLSSDDASGGKTSQRRKPLRPSFASMWRSKSLSFYRC